MEPAKELGIRKDWVGIAELPLELANKQAKLAVLASWVGDWVGEAVVSIADILVAFGFYNALFIFCFQEVDVAILFVLEFCF